MDKAILLAQSDTAVDLARVVLTREGYKLSSIRLYYYIITKTIGLASQLD